MYEFKNISQNTHKTMKKLKSNDTSIETVLRKELWRRGYRFRKNDMSLPGKPDIVLTKYKIAIFCDGEFFHGKDWNARKLKLAQGNNGDYWVKKISRNRERDDEINKKLSFMGWTVIRFWGHDIKEDTNECIKVIEEAIFDIEMRGINITEEEI
jgi:DNA mismatch endonuclease Vsr